MWGAISVNANRPAKNAELGCPEKVDQACFWITGSGSSDTPKALGELVQKPLKGLTISPCTFTCSISM